MMTDFVAVNGQSFASHQDWVNRATRKLTSHPEYHNTEHDGPKNGWRGEHFVAMCFDQKGRRCRNGGDFQRAESDGLYPIWWVWPDQIAELIINARQEPEIVDMSDAITAYEDDLLAQAKEREE